MTDVGQIERKTQDRVVGFFGRPGLRIPRQLGIPRGQRQHRSGPAGSEPSRSRLRRQPHQQGARQAEEDASLGGGRDLYEANRDVYNLLRYGVKVRPGIGEQIKKVWLIDWEHPEANHFALAEEVTVHGQHTKRPDVVLYVNGIALVTLELKRSQGRRLGGHPADHRQPEAGVHPPVLHHGAARDGG